MNKSKAAPKPEVRRVPVTLLAPTAAEVAVTGDFTGWSVHGIPLERAAQGSWTGVLELAPGEYEYRFRIDGRWEDDPCADRRTPNPFGSENCILVVED